MIEMEEEEKVDLTDNITLYALSTCMWCKKTKDLLNSENVKYTCIHVNEIEGEELEKAREEVAKLNPSRSYPTMKVDDEVIVGFKPDVIKEAVDNCRQRKKSMS